MCAAFWTMATRNQTGSTACLHCNSSRHHNIAEKLGEQVCLADGQKGR